MLRREFTRRCFGLVAVAVLQLRSPQALAQTYAGPKCLGPYCLASIKSEDITKTLGPYPNSPCCLYRSKDQKAFLTIWSERNSASIGLSMVPAGGTKYAEYYAVVQQNLHSWKTPEAITLGSSESDIRRAYGKPTREEIAPYGRTEKQIKKALVYRGPYGAGTASAFFGVQHDKLTALVIAKTPYSGPDCLGPFCVENTIKSSNALLQGLEDPRPSTRGSLNCYREPGEHAFAQVEMGGEGSGLLLSDFPTCAHASHAVERVTAADIQSWKTPEGIGLGSSKEDVLRVYGKPTREDKVSNTLVFRGYKPGQISPDAGELEVFYGSKELTWARFGVRHGKVSYIWLANSE